MNYQSDTAARLVEAAKRLFSQHGYKGTSVRAITAMAEANLGAITYHFGSKEALYDAAFASLIEPLRRLAVQAANAAGTPLDRLELIVRGLFQYLIDHPEFPDLASHHLAGSRPLPTPAREMLQQNLRTISSLIAEGQRDGSIRVGDPLYLTLSIVAQPMWLTLARRILLEGMSIDQEKPEIRREIVDSVVHFVIAGLAKHGEDQ